jgi:hypothetical protein
MRARDVDKVNVEEYLDEDVNPHNVAQENAVIGDMNDEEVRALAQYYDEIEEEPRAGGSATTADEIVWADELEINTVDEIDRLLLERLEYITLMRRRELLRQYSPSRGFDRNYCPNPNECLDPRLRKEGVPGRFSIGRTATSRNEIKMRLLELRRQRFAEINPGMEIPENITDEMLLEPRARGPLQSEIVDDDAAQTKAKNIRNMVEEIRTIQLLMRERFRETGGDRRDQEWRALGNQIKQLRDILRIKYGITEQIDMRGVLGGTRRHIRKTHKLRRTKKRYVEKYRS